MASTCQSSPRSRATWNQWRLAGAFRVNRRASFMRCTTVVPPLFAHYRWIILAVCMASSQVVHLNSPTCVLHVCSGCCHLLLICSLDGGFACGAPHRLPFTGYFRMVSFGFTPSSVSGKVSLRCSTTDRAVQGMRDAFWGNEISHKRYTCWIALTVSLCMYYPSITQGSVQPTKMAAMMMLHCKAVG